MDNKSSPSKAKICETMRPKTATSMVEAVDYAKEGLDDPDFHPSRDIFYTDQVRVEERDGQKMVNEFILIKTIGKGAYSKVKLVTRKFMDEQETRQEQFGMKIMHKPTLIKDRCANYLPNGDFEMSNSLEKVWNEIDVWSRLNHNNICRLYEMIDDASHDYIYLVMEYCDLGQISIWDFEKELYMRNEKIVEHIVESKAQEGQEFDDHFAKVIFAAKILFRDVISAVEHMHENDCVHRDLKCDNILYSST